MEMEYSQLISWSTHSTPPTDASSQWGHNIKIVGEPRKIAVSKTKSFLADMFGFVTNGEFSAVSNYSKNHGGFELEQVSAAEVLQAFMGRLRSVTGKRLVTYCVFVADCCTCLFVAVQSNHN